MSDDLIKRLRDQQTKFMTPILGQAADALEAAKRENERLNTVLDEIAAAEPRFSYVEIKGEGENREYLPGSPYDRGLAEGYRRLQAHIADCRAAQQAKEE